MLGYLDDIASDLSVFHRIEDAGEMEAAVFFTLACRLPAYSGVLAARLAAEDDTPRSPSGRGNDTSGTYERNSPQAGTAATAQHAPPATAAMLGQLNAQLGGHTFSHTTVVPGG